MPPAGLFLKISSFRFATFTFTLVFLDLFLLLSLSLYHTFSEKSEPCDDFSLSKTDITSQIESVHFTGDIEEWSEATLTTQKR